MTDVNEKKVFRYPGIMPFSKEQARIFFGRKDDIENLYRSVLKNSCTVVFGKSGIGKSSLINAGLIPAIEKDYNQNTKDQHCTVVPFILETYNDKAETLKDQSNFVQVVNSYSGKEIFLNALPSNLKQSLWYKLKTQQFAAQQNNVTENFLIIFDQLERVFTYPPEQIRQFLFSLADLQSLNIPDEVEQAIFETRSQNENAFSNEELNSLYKPLQVKFLFSIRSDKLNLIARFNKIITAILQNLYELLPLGKTQAIEAIEAPSKEISDTFITKPFGYAKELLNAITTYLEQANNEAVLTVEDKTIEPFNLQIICSHIEQKFAPRSDEKELPDDIKEITPDKVGPLENIILTYFTDTLEKIFSNENEREKIINLIYEKFIDDKNNIRKQVYISDAGISEINLEKLCSSGLFRKEMHNIKEVYYELSHDKLIAAVKSEKINIFNLNEQRNARQGIDISRNNTSVVSDVNKLQNSQPGSAMATGVNVTDHTWYVSIANEYLSSRDYDNAILYFTKAIAIAEQNNASPIEIYRARSNAYYYQGKFEDSTHDLKKILSLNADDFLANYYLGLNYKDLYKDDEALSYLMKAAEINPSSAGVYTDIGNIYFEQKEYEKAKNNYCKTIEIDVSAGYAYRNLGLIEESLGNADNAIAYYKEAINHNAESAELLNDIGNVFYNKQEYKQAKEYYEKAIAKDAGFYYSVYNLGLVAEANAQTDDAIKYYTKALEINSGYADAYYQLGELYLNNLNFNEAIKNFTAVISVNNQYVNAYNERGRCYYALGKFEEAVIDYTSAIKIDPKYYTAYYNIALAQNNLNNIDGALYNFKQAIEYKSDYKEAYYQLGETYFSKGNYHDAIEMFLKTISIDNNNTDAYNELGRCYFALNNYKEAANCFSKIVEMQPANSLYLSNLAAAELNLGNIDEAENYVKQSLQIDPKFALANLNYADILEKKNKLTEAIQYYKKVVELNPADEATKQHIEELQKTLN